LAQKGDCVECHKEGEQIIKLNKGRGYDSYSLSYRITARVLD